MHRRDAFVCKVPERLRANADVPNRMDIRRMEQFFTVCAHELFFGGRLQRTANPKMNVLELRKCFQHYVQSLVKQANTSEPQKISSSGYAEILAVKIGRHSEGCRMINPQNTWIV